MAKAHFFSFVLQMEKKNSSMARIRISNFAKIRPYPYIIIECVFILKNQKLLTHTKFLYLGFINRIFLI